MYFMQAASPGSIGIGVEEDRAAIHAGNMDPGPTSFLLASLLMGDVFVQELADHFLILHIMLLRFLLEVIDAFLAQGDSNLGVPVLQRQVARGRKKVRHRPELADRLICVSNLLFHKYPFLFSSIRPRIYEWCRTCK